MLGTCIGRVTTVARELTKYKLYVAVQEVRGDTGGTLGAGNYVFSLEKETKVSIGNRIFAHRGVVSAVERAEFVSGKISYIVLRDHWCNIIAYQ